MAKKSLLNHAAIVVLLCLGALHCSNGNSSRTQRSLPSPSDQLTDPSYNLEVKLDGRYVKGLRIDKKSLFAIGPQQILQLTLRAEGMDGIGQFEADIELEPPGAFDIAGSTFEPVTPFVTLPGGIDPMPSIKNRIKIGGADLAKTTHGDAPLGTLNLKTSADFGPWTKAHIRIVFFSMGPTSQDRDNYSAQDLNMGLIINQK